MLNGHPSGGADRLPSRGAAWRDGAAVAAFTALVWAAAVHFELFERYLRVTEHLERWQVDETLFALTALGCGLSWLAMRRWRDADRVSRMHRESERTVAELLSRNRELAQQLIAVQENERRALARELHDEVGQSCSVIRVEAALVERAALADPDGARAAAQRIEAAADALHQCVRGMLRRLRPADLDALGVLGAIQSLCERWETRSGIACVFHHGGSAQAWAAVPDPVAVTVYRVVQEALTNVTRHARATQVKIVLMLGPAAPGDDLTLALGVQDDGIGMDPRAGTGGLGLLGARERAALLGGALRIDSAQGHGTSLRMSLPIAAPAAADGPSHAGAADGPVAAGTAPGAGA